MINNIERLPQIDKGSHWILFFIHGEFQGIYVLYWSCHGRAMFIVRVMTGFEERLEFLVMFIHLVVYTRFTYKQGKIDIGL
jgi:hypothetical protein